MSKPIFSPYLHPLLRAHQYQGNSNDCGPFSTAIVLNALLGLDLGGRELARRMNNPHWLLFIPIIRRIPDWATFPWGIVDMLRSFRLHAGWRLFSSPAQLLTGLFEGQIVMPIFGGWNPLWAHTTILAAYHNILGWGLINPANASGGLQWLSNDEFLPAWRSMGSIMIYAEFV